MRVSTILAFINALPKPEIMEDVNITDLVGVIEALEKPLEEPKYKERNKQ